MISFALEPSHEVERHSPSACVGVSDHSLLRGPLGTNSVESRWGRITFGHVVLRLDFVVSLDVVGVFDPPPLVPLEFLGSCRVQGFSPSPGGIGRILVHGLAPFPDGGCLAPRVLTFSGW